MKKIRSASGRNMPRHFSAGLPGIYLTVIVFLLSAILFPKAGAVQNGDGTSGRADAALNCIYSYLCGTAESPEAETALIDLLSSGELPGEFRYVSVLAGNGHTELTEQYSFNLLKKHISSDGSFDNELRTALSLAYTGFPFSVSYIDSTVDSHMADPGLNVKLYILRLVCAGYGSDVSSYGSTLLSDILARRLADGGWAFSGERSDPDMTAMVLTTLSFCQRNLSCDPQTSAALRESIDGAVKTLSAMQRPDGSFASYGNKNAESCAQVIIALSGLGLDADSDPAFVKNGRSLLDALLDFQLPDGSFSHLSDGDTDAGATAQCFEALSAYVSFRDGKPGLPDFPAPDRIAAQTAVLPTPDTSSAGSEAETDTGFAGLHGARAAVAAASAIAAIVICAVMFAKGRRKLSGYLTVIAVASAVAAAVLFIDIRLPGDGSEITEKQNPIGKVTLVISCRKVAGQTDAYPSIPNDGLILGETSFKIAKGDTVYTVLCDASARYSFLIDAKGGGTGVYIRSVAGLSERDFGELSGWTYRVNDIPANVGCGAYRLSDGDVIVWEYTVDGNP